jgi:hypothetical protein
MNASLAPYSEIINALVQWANNRNADNMENEKAPEILKLQEYDEPEISKALSAILAFAEPEIRLHAIDALPYLVSRDVMIELLIPSLSDPSPGIRWTVCEVFHGYPDSRVVLPLANVLENDPEPDVRVVAAEALFAVGDERAIPALILAKAHDNGKDYEDRTVAHAAGEAIIAIEKRVQST